MFALKKICGTFGILLFVTDAVLSMYISSNKSIPEQVCDMMPASINISCREFIIPDDSYCTEEKLGKLFPKLYHINNPSEGTDWPGPIQDHKANGSSQTWGVPKDGSIKYLRGFQVIQQGIDPTTFGITKCSVFDVSNVLEEDLRQLMETTFVINLEGKYDVEIKSLPIAPVKLATKQPIDFIQPVLGGQSVSVYHPELSVEVRYFKLNDSTMNITVDVSPEINDLTSMAVQIFCSNGSLLQTNPDSFEISDKSFIVNGLSVGNYTLKLTPNDPYAITIDYDINCLCYFEVYDGRMCTPCEGYASQIYMSESAEFRPTSDEGESSSLMLVLAPVISIGIAMVILLVVCRVFLRNNRLPSFINSTRLFSKDETCITNEESEDKRPVLQIIYTNDHVHHKTVAGCLATLLKNSTVFEVNVDCYPFREMTNASIGSLHTSEMINFHGKQCHNADVILLIHSDWAYKLKAVIETGDVSIVDITDAEDKRFLLCINEIFQRPILTSKLVSVRFEYTQESSIIKQPFLGPQFNLPSNIDALVKHLTSKTNKQQQPDTLDTSPEDKMSMFTAINAVFTHHSKHKTWLFTKLFNLKNSSSDDSGVDLKRPRYLRTRSIRSRSADTLPLQVCTCGETNNIQQTCLLHYRKPCLRQRTYSCDLSFYPPESITDEVSERYSLLESKFLRVNSRYKKILNNEMDDSDEYITLDELSV